jgi:hypothetical protein
MNRKFRIAVGIAALGVSTLAVAQVTFYEGDGFRGQAFTVDQLTRISTRSASTIELVPPSCSADAGKCVKTRTSRVAAQSFALAATSRCRVWA